MKLVAAIFRPNSVSQLGGCSLVALACLFFGSVIAPAVLADDTGAVAAQSRTREVVAGVPRSWPPQYGVDENGRPIGFAIDVMDEIAARADVRVTYRVMDSFAEVSEAMNAGHIDLIPNSGMTPERLAKFAFTSPVETFVVSIFVRKDTLDIIRHADLAGHRVAVVEFNVGQRLMKERQDIELVVHRDARTALFNLLAGKVDAFVFPQPVLLSLASQVGVDGRIKAVGMPLKELKRGIRVQKGDTELLARLNKVVDNFVGTPDYQAIYVRWYGRPTPLWTVDRVLWVMGGLVIAVLVVMALWRYRSVVRLNRNLRESMAELEQTERILRESEELFSKTFRANPSMLIISDPKEGRTCQVSDSCVQIMGYSREEMIGKPIAELNVWVVPEDRRCFIEILMRDGFVRNFETQLRTKSGDSRFVELAAELFELGGKPRMLLALHDITERREAETARREGEENLKNLAANVPGVVYQRVLHADGTTTYPYVSPGVREMYGYEPEEIETDPSRFRRAVVSEDRETFEASLDTSVETMSPWQWEGRVTTKNDQIKWVQVIARPRHRESGDILWDGLILDTTDRKRAEAELRESEERYRQLVNVSPDGVLVHSEGKIVFANSALARILGADSPEILIGKTVDDLVPADERAYVAERRKELTEGAQLGLRETRFLRLDGLEIPVERAPARIRWQGKPSFLVVVRDISERKSVERELRLSQQQAEAANRAKSEFLANMSHELRTPLNAIIGFSEIIRSQTFGPEGGPQYRQYASDIHDSGQHLLDLINDILDLSKIESVATDLDEEEVDIIDVVRAVMTLVKERAAKGGVQLELDIPSGLPRLRSDRRKLKQILINLLSNGIKFTEEGGKVTLRAWCREDSGYVLQVADTGIGMALEDIPKALAPFGQVDSDLDRKYEGTGLGLPLTKALVEMHSGSMDIQSQVGAGTTVTVRFPAERIVNVASLTHMGAA